MLKTKCSPAKFMNFLINRINRSYSDFVVTISEIREEINIVEKYQNYADLKKRIVVPTIKLFNKDLRYLLWLEYEEIKERKKVIALSFKLNKKYNFEKTAKLTIEIPLSASLKINRIVDAKKLNGEKYSKQKFLTEAVLEAIEKAK